MIALRAALLGITLKTLEATVDSDSDDHILLGMDETIPAGPLSMRTRARIGADGVTSERLREFVAWAEAHSPRADAVHRVVPARIEVEIA